MKNQNKASVRKGFSLVEVVIAIGIVAILLTTFMAVFGPAQKNIVRALGVADVNRLTSTLENELAVLRPGEEDIYKLGSNNGSAFEKSFQWIKESGQKSSAVILYQYQADPKKENKDKTLKAVSTTDTTDKSNLPGVDYITQTIARRVDKDTDNYVEAELLPGIISGSVYVVRMTQLVNKSNTDSDLELGRVGEIKNSDGTAVDNSGLLTDGHIIFQAEFFRLNNNLAGFVKNGNWTIEQLGAPVAIQNLAVRR